MELTIEVADKRHIGLCSANAMQHHVLHGLHDQILLGRLARSSALRSSQRRWRPLLP